MMTKNQRVGFGFMVGSIIFTNIFWLVGLPDPYLAAMCLGGIIGTMIYNE